MPPVVIENPVINSPYKEPERYHRFSDEGITDEIVAGRRPSSYFVPIAKPKAKRGQLMTYATKQPGFDRPVHSCIVTRIAARRFRRRCLAGLDRRS